MHDMFTKQGQSHWLILGHMAFTKIKCTLQHKERWKVAKQKAGKTLPGPATGWQFSFW